jgi:hypothetical protein
MDSKTAGTIGTIVTTLFCGCPGLLAVCWGVVAAFASQMPGADIDVGGSSDPMAALVAGVGSICIGAIFVAIPVVVGIISSNLNKRAAAPANYNEPLPPAL